MLQENMAVSEQLSEHRLALQTKDQECDQAHITVALQAKEIHALKLQVDELLDYKNRYDSQTKVSLQSKETEIEDLHKEIESMTSQNTVLVKQINGEKELLIAQNLDLKK